MDQIMPYLCNLVLSLFGFASCVYGFLCFTYRCSGEYICVFDGYGA